MVACAMGRNLDLIDKLLDLGADAGLRDSFGVTAMMDACRNGNDMVVKGLVERGIRLEVNDICLVSQMCHCVFNQNTDFLKCVLLATVDGGTAGAADEGSTLGEADRAAKMLVLKIAASKDAVLSAQIVVESGAADFRMFDSEGHTLARTVWMANRPKDGAHASVVRMKAAAAGDKPRTSSSGSDHDTPITASGAARVLAKNIVPGRNSFAIGRTAPLLPGHGPSMIKGGADSPRPGSASRPGTSPSIKQPEQPPDQPEKTTI